MKLYIHWRGGTICAPASILPTATCTAFFHPRLNDEPLIFVEVALCDRMVDSIGTILSGRREHTDPATATVAMFYSISNCQDGLKGIPLGSFLIKQVVEDLRQRFEGLRTFATLSPLPSFRKWLNRQVRLQGGKRSRRIGSGASSD